MTTQMVGYFGVLSVEDFKPGVHVVRDAESRCLRVARENEQGVALPDDFTIVDGRKISLPESWWIENKDKL